MSVCLVKENRQSGDTGVESQVESRENPDIQEVHWGLQEMKSRLLAFEVEGVLIVA